MDVTPEDLKSYHLLSGKTISLFVVKELDAIGKVVKNFTGRNIFETSKLNKNEKVNIINKLFGDGLDVNTRPKGVHSYGAYLRNKDPLKLKVLAKRQILKPMYPKLALAAAVCCVKCEDVENEWESQSPVPLYVYLPFMNEAHRMYWYPEYCNTIQEHLMCTLDPTHLLTNMRTAFTQKGALGLNPEDYSYIWKAGIISQITLEDNLDQQNASTAKNCFSTDVEQCLVKNGRIRAAKVVHTVREWYEACDERQLSAEQCVVRSHKMSKLLLEKMNFEHFPPPGNNVQGMQLVTYEGILQTNSLQICLYKYAEQGTYNHRAISTLAAESFFSDLKAIEFTTPGCPKAVQIPIFLVQVVQMNMRKHDPSKIFYMKLTANPVYPTYASDLKHIDLVVPVQQECYFKNHSFDLPVPPVIKQSRKKH